MKGLRLVVVKGDKSVIDFPIRIEDQVFTLLTLDWGVPSVVSVKDYDKIEDCLFSIRDTIIQSYVKHHLDLDYPTDYKNIDVDINNGMTEVMVEIYLNETNN